MCAAPREPAEESAALDASVTLPRSPGNGQEGVPAELSIIDERGLPVSWTRWTPDCQKTCAFCSKRRRTAVGGGVERERQQA